MTRKRQSAMLAAILSLLLVFTGCTDKENLNTTQTDIIQQSDTTNPGTVAVPDNAYEIGNGIFITEISSYTGKFIEDNSDREVADIMQLTILNTSETAYQLGSFTLHIAGTEYHFTFTTLFAGAAMTVLEKDAAEMPVDTTIDDCTDVTLAEFGFEASTHSELFEISVPYDMVMNVQNNSDHDMSAVKVFFKTVDDNGVYIGGITYCITAGDIEAGSIIQTMSNHLSASHSKICFVTYPE